VRPISFSVYRVTAVRSSIRRAAAGATALDIWAVVLPALSPQFHSAVTIVSELVALVILPWLPSERLLVPRWLIAWGAWLVFQVVTDLVVHSAFADWSRGWAAIIFTLIDLAVIITLVSPREGLACSPGHGAAAFSATSSLPTHLQPLTRGSGHWPLRLPSSRRHLVGSRRGRRPWLAVGAFAISAWATRSSIRGMVAWPHHGHLPRAALLVTGRRGCTSRQASGWPPAWRTTASRPSSSTWA
jgi:hypothetical protein